MDMDEEDRSDEQDDTLTGRFFPRDPKVSGADAERLRTRNMLVELSRDVNWALASCNSDLDTGLSQIPEGILDGITINDPMIHKSKINLSFELLEPLLPDNISRMIVADQKLSVVKVTIAELHELCVSCQVTNIMAGFQIFFVADV